MVYLDSHEIIIKKIQIIFFRLDYTVLSHCGGCPGGGGKTHKNVFKLENKRDSLH
jgi:hypothetical protein